MVEDTKTLVAGAAANQEQLANAAQSAVLTITQLAECVKHGAASIGSEQPEAQVGTPVCPTPNHTHINNVWHYTAVGVNCSPWVPLYLCTVNFSRRPPSTSVIILFDYVHIISAQLSSYLYRYMMITWSITYFEWCHSWCMQQMVSFVGSVHASIKAFFKLRPCMFCLQDIHMHTIRHTTSEWKKKIEIYF